MRWIRGIFRPRPLVTVHVALEQTGRGATFHLYKEFDRWMWDWSADELASPTPDVAARVEAECRWAISAMEQRLNLPLTFPQFAEIPEGLQRCPGWPWDRESEGPHPPLKRS